MNHNPDWPSYDFISGKCFFKIVPDHFGPLGLSVDLALSIFKAAFQTDEMSVPVAKADAVGSCEDCCVADFCRCQGCGCWQILRSLGYRTPCPAEIAVLVDEKRWGFQKIRRYLHFRESRSPQKAILWLRCRMNSGEGQVVFSWFGGFLPPNHPF